MKKIYLLFSMMFMAGLLSARPVDENTARTTALNFIQYHTSASFKATPQMAKVYAPQSREGTTDFYVFNFDHGFIIIAADDRVIPVLAYSNEGTFRSNDLPENVSGWLQGYQVQIENVVNHNISAPAAVAREWNNLLHPEYAMGASKNSNAVSPLCSSTWDQLPYYNDQCPYDNTRKRHTVTGCVATAMAQVMYKWKYPATGYGFYSYNDQNYGTQSANFGGTTYNWSGMKDNVSSANAAVATLMYQSGVGVNMNYGADESSAYVISAKSPQKNCAEYALKKYFGYDATGISRSNYSDADWLAKIKGEMDAGRPVIYAGLGNGGGHCFVVDGYDANSALHVNWGWGGLYNGNFAFDALNPGGVGTGGGTGAYNDDQQAIIGIEPSKALAKYNIALNSAASLSSSTINFTNSFTVSTTIANTGGNNFSGDFCAQIYDNTNALIDSTDIQTGISINSGKTSSSLTFSYPGTAALVPGTYTVQVFYRPTNGNWVAVANGSYNNVQTLTVKLSAPIELYDNITVSQPALYAGRKITVNTNVANMSNFQFDGVVALFVYNRDGSAAGILGIDTVSIPANSSLTAGLTYDSALHVEPGTYSLALLYQPNGGPWGVVGSTSYQNPVRIVVQAAPLSPDKYEKNNTKDSAYIFGANFTNDTARISTAGSNCHIGTDYDFYEIKLAAKYKYSFRTMLSSLNYSDNGQAYTLDGIYSYTTDNGAHWSDIYKDSMPAPLTDVIGGGNIIFKVSPAFTGITGTYLLDIKIQRSPYNGIENTDAQHLRIYPNPAHDILNIQLPANTGKPAVIELTDLSGKKVYSGIMLAGQLSGISLDGIAKGMYLLTVKSDGTEMHEKVEIAK